MSGGEGYSAEVRQLFRETPGAGRPGGPGWASGEASEPLTATRVRWHLKAAGGVLVEVRYEVRGCPHTVAGTALAARDLTGRPVASAGLDPEALARRLEAPAAKRGRFFVIQDALREALLQLPMVSD